MLDKKVALVTGASRGIGAAIAKKLAGEGAFVIVNYNGSKERAERVVDEIKAAGGEAAAVQCDVSDFEACGVFITELIKTYGRLDILVNNAGISHIGLLSDMSPEEWNRILQTNLTSVFNCCKQIIPGMVARQSGSIINISSVWGTYCPIRFEA